MFVLVAIPDEMKRIERSSDINSVSPTVGHANINTTDSIYTHLCNGEHASDMDKLDAVPSTAQLCDGSGTEPVARSGPRRSSRYGQ